MNLCDVNDSNAIRARIVEPSLVLYREAENDRSDSPFVCIKIAYIGTPSSYSKG